MTEDKLRKYAISSMRHLLLHFVILASGFSPLSVQSYPHSFPTGMRSTLLLPSLVAFGNGFLAVPAQVGL
jgi:hypothetical protein